MLSPSGPALSHILHYTCVCYNYCCYNILLDPSPVRISQISNMPCYTDFIFVSSFCSSINLFIVIIMYRTKTWLSNELWMKMFHSTENKTWSITYGAFANMITMNEFLFHEIYCDLAKLLLCDCWDYYIFIFISFFFTKTLIKLIWRPDLYHLNLWEWLKKLMILKLVSAHSDTGCHYLCMCNNPVSFMTRNG